MRKTLIFLTLLFIIIIIILAIYDGPLAGTTFIAAFMGVGAISVLGLLSVIRPRSDKEAPVALFTLGFFGLLFMYLFGDPNEFSKTRLWWGLIVFAAIDVVLKFISCPAGFCNNSRSIDLDLFFL